MRFGFRDRGRKSRGCSAYLVRTDLMLPSRSSVRSDTAPVETNTHCCIECDVSQFRFDGWSAGAGNKYPHKTGLSAASNSTEASSGFSFQIRSPVRHIDTTSDLHWMRASVFYLAPRHRPYPCPAPLVRTAVFPCSLMQLRQTLLT